MAEHFGSVIPGQVLTFDVNPDAWPFYVSFTGGEEIGAMPERYRDHRGDIRARASVTVPSLGRGSWDVILRDRDGKRLLGTINIT